MEFATRSQLADDDHRGGARAGADRWIAADGVYGNNTALRARLREQGLGYVLAVSRDHLVPLDGGKTRQRADRIATGLPATAWSRRSAGAGSKGHASTTGRGCTSCAPTTTPTTAGTTAY